MPQPNVPRSRQLATSNLWELSLFTLMVGAIAGVVLYVMWEYDIISAAFVGGGVGLLAGIVLAILLRRPSSRPADKPVGRAPRASAGREGSVVPAAGDDGSPRTTLESRTSGAPMDAGGVGRPATPEARSPMDPAEIPVAGAGVPPFTARDQASSGRSGSSSGEREVRTTERVAPKPATPEPAATDRSTGAQPYDPATAGGAPIVKPATARGAPENLGEPAADGPEPVKPPMLDAPREGGPDDLTQIRGIGPALESMLHRMGVYHFDQIASWSPAEVAWADENLEDFRGRVTRDDWVSQARELTSG